MSLNGRSILIVIGGGIAAYKVLELIRRLKEAGAAVRAAMSGSAHHFVTPLSVSAITGERVFDNLFDLDDEQEIGHIRLCARGRPDRRRSGDRRSSRQDGAWACGRPRLGGAARHRPAGAGRAGDEPEDVGASGDAAGTSRCLRRTACSFVGPETGEMAECGEAGARPAGGAVDDPRGDRSVISARRSARSQARAQS